MSAIGVGTSVAVAQMEPKALGILRETLKEKGLSFAPHP